MTDIEDFDLDKSTQEAWDAFTERLEEVLSVMDASADLSIAMVRGDEVDDDAPKVTYSAVGPDTIQATLDGPRDARLEEAGWTLHEGTGYTVTANQEDTAQLARLTVWTFVNVYNVLHPVFLAPDQLAEILNPAAEAKPHPILPEGGLSVLVPTSQEDLDAYIERELEEQMGWTPLRNAQGDLAIRVGSTVVFLRSTPDCQEVVLFSPLVHDVAGRSRAVEVLNDLNVESRFCRFALHKDRVFAQISVFSQPFVPGHLRQALEAISLVADGIDEELAARLSGRTTYPS